MATATTAATTDWDNAVKAVQDLMADNSDFLSSIYKISQYNQSYDRKTVFAEAMAESNNKGSSGTEPDLNFLLTTARTIQKDFGAVDLSAFVEEREQLTTDFAAERSNFGKISKSFADIVFKGPQNLTEEVLLVSAMAFLPPHEFKKAIASGMHPSQVATMVDQSKIKQFTDQVIETVAPQRVEAAVVEAAEPMPNILGLKMGVLDSIQNALESIGVIKEAAHDDAKKPPLTPPIDTSAQKSR